MDKERYSRHISLHNFGEENQQKLFNSSVLVVGVGGLGCPVLQYLTSMGIGKIGILDHDVVSLSNLQRQILYGTGDIGFQKVTVAEQKLKSLNPEIEITTYPFSITNKNALKIINSYDVIVDCTDNFATRYLINDACFLLKKPVVFAAIYEYEGQISVFNTKDSNGLKTNYRDVFPIPPSEKEAPNCNEVGVLGVLPGIIGTLQAMEVIKLITGIGEPLTSKMMTYNTLNCESYILEISANDNYEMPKNESEFENFDYDYFCGSSNFEINEISLTEFKEFLNDKNVLIIDVREENETPEADFTHKKFPLTKLNLEIPEIESDIVIVFCQSGKRSRLAAEILSKKYSDKKIYSLEGGILNYYK